MKLHQLAHARSGDKGNIADLTIFAYESRHYPFLERELTPERVRSHLGPLVQGEVMRFCLPHLHAIKFVLHAALAGGVTRSLALDAHGKCFSSVVLELELPDER